MFDFFTAGTDKSGVATEANAENSPKSPDEQNYLQVKTIIDELRPFLQSDGGDCELLKLEDNVVYVRLVGSCVGCPSSLMTLKAGIEARIKEAIPAIESVEMI
ncbi:MAG: NifU family protein [Candidatus Sumerlaeaceae bacterium]|nr:NifU family protein [Candidatus Sumerlaeaceae bacterium]